MTWSALAKLIPWRWLGYGLAVAAIAAVVIGAIGRVLEWAEAHDRLPEVEARLQAELLCAPGSQCAKHRDTAKLVALENTVEVLNGLESELLAIRAQPAAPARVIRVCRDADAGGRGVSLSGAATGGDAGTPPAGQFPGADEFSTEPLRELARDADEIVARCRGLQDWNKGMQRWSAAMSEGAGP